MPDRAATIFSAPGFVEPLLTKRQVAQLLGVTQRTIDNWRSEGRLRAAKLGPGVVRFDPAEIRSFIDHSSHRADHVYGGDRSE